MRFLTRAWALGELEDSARQAVACAYERHVADLAAQLPSVARSLARLNLHDAVFDAVCLRRATGDLAVELVAGDQQAGYQLVKLDYVDLHPAGPWLACLETAASDPKTEVLDHEVDLSADGRLVHRLLFWPDGEVALEFGGLRLQVSPRTHRRTGGRLD